MQAPDKVAVCLFDVFVFHEDPSESTTAVDLAETAAALVTIASDPSASPNTCQHCTLFVNAVDVARLQTAKRVFLAIFSFA